MSLPVVYVDVVFLGVILVAAAAIGLVIGRWGFSRRTSSSEPETEPSEVKLFLQLMSRTDHVLENYVTSILGNLLVLGEELPTDGERWRVSREAIGQAATQIKRHIERLRLIRIGLDATSLRIAPVNLARLIENILINLESEATERDVTLRMEVGRFTQPIPGDPEMLEETFTTLLDNAIKHNPPGTEVVAELTSQDGTAIVRISDTGKGISEDLVARIFDEGARDRGAGSSRGSGMGLYIAKMLTELQGGAIKVESQPGKGSTFSVALPFRRPDR